MKAELPLKLIVVFGLALMLSLAGCGRASRPAGQSPDVEVSLTVDPSPPGVGASRMVITLTDAGGAPIDGAEVTIKGDMIHAGMKPVLAEVSGGSGGRYETPFEWTMGGDWIVTVTARLPDGRLAARQFDLSVQGSMSMDKDLPVGGDGQGEGHQ